MPLFSGVATAAGVFALAFAAACAACGRRLLSRLARRPSAPIAPPITIIKPLKGDEADLYENLASFCRQDYPSFQIIFCLQSNEDPALDAARRLQRDFPRVDVEVVVSSRRIGYNPKVNNMANAYALAKHDLLLMSDSDVRVGPDFLRRMAAPFADPRVGLVTAFYRAAGARGPWANLEALSINAGFLPQALCASFFGMRFAMGAAMAVRRAAFEAAGTFPNLADHLADDFWLGESVRAAGWTLELCGAVVEMVPQVDSGADYLKHLTRWARTIRLCQPAGYAASLVQHGFSLLTLKILLAGPDRLSVALLAAIWAAKAAASAAVLSAAGGDLTAGQLCLLPAAEWVSFVAWIGGCSSSRVLWRGELFEVRPQGRLVPAARPLLRRPLAVEP